MSVENLLGLLDEGSVDLADLVGGDDIRLGDHRGLSDLVPSGN